MNAHSNRPKALIVLSSAKHLPLREPHGDNISTGYFLVELAAIMARFEATHDFVLATPDGALPQLDINGMALGMQGGSDLGSATAHIALESDLKKMSPEQLREKNPKLLARRETELALSRRLMGKMSLSEVLPNTDREAASIRGDIIASFEDLPYHTYHSIEQLISMHRDPESDFSLADFDFVHMPGGHAPMVDFNDNPWMGELLNTLHESGVLISLICHAPIALTSARYRVSADGAVSINDNHIFKGANITTVPKYGELAMLSFGYPKVPGKKTRLLYYVDVALKEAGYDVSLTLNPAAVNVVWDEARNLLTGNGPQAVDEQASRLVEIIAKQNAAQ